VVRVIVDNRIRVRLEDIPEDVATQLRERFTHRNPKREAMKRAKVKGWWAEPMIIATHGEADGWLTLPRGGVSTLREVLAANGLTMKVRDAREGGEVDTPYLFPDHRVELRAHQERIVQKCIERQNCLVKSGTGSGKTTALIALFARLGIPTLVLVHSNALMDQWVRRAETELGIREKDLGMFKGKKRHLRPLTIATTASFLKHVGDHEVREYFGAVFADEVHLFAARTFFACIDPMPAKYRIGVSDDVRRKDRMEFLIHDLFGEVAIAVDDAELVKNRYVLDVECLIVPTTFEAEWYGVPENDQEDKSPDFGRLVKEMAADEEREQLIERIITSELNEGRQLLAMAHEREHCAKIGQFTARHAPTGYLIGGPAYKAEFKRTIGGMMAGKVRAGVGTFQACGTGIDLPGVEVVVASTPVLSNRQRFRQARGRACRAPAGKTVARFYVLWDREVYGIRHLENAAAWNPTTFVWDGRWVPIREYLKSIRT